MSVTVSLITYMYCDHQVPLPRHCCWLLQGQRGSSSPSSGRPLPTVPSNTRDSSRGSRATTPLPTRLPARVVASPPGRWRCRPTTSEPNCCAAGRSSQHLLPFPPLHPWPRNGREGHSMSSCAQQPVCRRCWNKELVRCVAARARAPRTCRRHRTWAGRRGW